MVSPIYVVWMVSIGAVFYLSVSPQIEFPVDFTCADKVYHAIAYAWLSFLPFFGFRRMRISILCALLMIPLGVGLELGQAVVPGRFSALSDAIANLLGVALGILLAISVKSLRKTLPSF